MSVSQDRLTGYRRALEAGGVAWDPALEESGDFSHEGGIHAMRALLERRPTLDAVFAASDLMAAGALLALREAERRVPEDVAVVGYEDSMIAATTMPPLTSVRQPSEEMGREMARLLVGMIGSQRQVARRVLLATELVARGSSGENAPTLAAE
jgi:DNA-binding LacI/PurR family transcriptional regulator